MPIHARVLGIAQDAGVPHAGCSCARCERHRDAPLLPASLGLVGERGVYLIDATPELPRQLRLLPARPDAVLLTHLHMGHIAGLLHFGRESMATREVPLHATPAVCSFLERNGPWDLLFQDRHLAAHAHDPGTRFALEPGLEVEAIEVPHRNEHGDTVAWLVHGPRRSLLYLPDIDEWSLDPDALCERCDVALLDGSFHSRGEFPRQGDVPHPPITETLSRLSPASVAKVRFLHLNHTNPVLDADGPAVPLARQGETLEL